MALFADVFSAIAQGPLVLLVAEQNNRGGFEATVNVCVIVGVMQAVDDHVEEFCGREEVAENGLGCARPFSL